MRHRFSRSHHFLQEKWLTNANEFSFVAQPISFLIAPLIPMSVLAQIVLAMLGCIRIS